MKVGELAYFSPYGEFNSEARLLKITDINEHDSVFKCKTYQMITPSGNTVIALEHEVFPAKQ